MDSQNASYNAGQAQGQAEVKKDQIVDKASNTMQSMKDSASEVRNVTQQAGQTVKDKASGAADAMKNATGMNK